MIPYVIYVEEKLICSKMVKWPEGISFSISQALPRSFRLDFLYRRFLTMNLKTCGALCSPRNLGQGSGQPAMDGCSVKSTFLALE